MKLVQYVFALLLATLVVIAAGAQNIENNPAIVSGVNVESIDDSLDISNPDTIAAKVSPTSKDSLTSMDSIKSDTIIKTIVSDISKNAIDNPIPYKAKDSIRFEVQNKMVYLYGSAEVYYKDIVLKSERIEVDLKNNTVFAYGVLDSVGEKTGRPEYTDSKDSFIADSMKYNIRTKRGVISNVRTEDGGATLISVKTKMHENGEIHVFGGKYTTCTAEHPHFYIALSKAKVIPDDKIVAGPAHLVVEDVPTPFFLPFGFFPNNKKHKSGILLPEYGEELNRGFYLRNGGYYWAINDYADLSVRADIFSRKSWGGSLQSNYKKRYRFSGTINTKYNVNYLEDTVNNKAYNIRWEHRQDPKARPNSSFSAMVDFGSSGYNLYNSQSIDSRMRNTAQSSISYRQALGKRFNLSTNINHLQNFSDSTITLKIPSMNLGMSKLYPFKNIGQGNKRYKKIGISYTGNFNNSVTTKESDLMNGKAWGQFKNGIKHDVSTGTSVKILKYITLAPNARWSERWYFERYTREWNDTITTSDSTHGAIEYDTISGFHRTSDYSLGASLSSKIYGMYNFKEDGKIKGMMHVVTPSVSMSWRPDFGEKMVGEYFNGKMYSGQFDSVIVSVGSDSLFGANHTFIGMDTTRVLYNPYEGAIFGNASYGKSGMLSFSLANTLEMKVKDRKDTLGNYKKVKILDALNFSSSYNLAADTLKWSVFRVTGRTKLFGNLGLNFSATVDPYAIDTNGVRINTFEWRKNEDSRSYYDQNQKFNLGRLTTASIALDMSFSSKKGKKEKDKENESLPENYLDYYVDFDIPWNFRMNYSLNYNKSFDRVTKQPKEDITQTLRCSGDVNLTTKWKIGFSSGYDVQQREMTQTSVDIYRDLHCWEMRFNWVPFGNYMSYNFTIQAKSTLLQDLKLNKRKSWWDNF